MISIHLYTIYLYICGILWYCIPNHPQWWIRQYQNNNNKHQQDPQDKKRNRCVGSLASPRLAAIVWTWADWSGMGSNGGVLKTGVPMGTPNHPKLDHFGHNPRDPMILGNPHCKKPSNGKCGWFMLILAHLQLRWGFVNIIYWTSRTDGSGAHWYSNFDTYPCP